MNSYEGFEMLFQRLYNFAEEVIKFTGKIWEFLITPIKPPIPNITISSGIPLISDTINSFANGALTVIRATFAWLPNITVIELFTGTTLLFLLSLYIFKQFAPGV